MSNYRRPRRRVDANHEAVVSGLRAAGYSVQSLATLGGGVPDLLVGSSRGNVLIEIKSPGEKVSAQQMLWHANWKGEVHTVSTVDEALEALQ